MHLHFIERWNPYSLPCFSRLTFINQSPEQKVVFWKQSQEHCVWPWTPVCLVYFWCHFCPFWIPITRQYGSWNQNKYKGIYRKFFNCLILLYQTIQLKKMPSLRFSNVLWSRVILFVRFSFVPGTAIFVRHIAGPRRFWWFSQSSDRTQYWYTSVTHVWGTENMA